MKRHLRDNYFVVDEGIYCFDGHGQPQVQRPTDEAALRKFRFSRMGPQGDFIDGGVRALLAAEMTRAGAQPDSHDPVVPAGYTYLGQFVDHDLTFDRTAASLGQAVTVAELVQGRSPALDLDCLYGRGPEREPRFYSDGVRLRTGNSQASPQPLEDEVTVRDLEGADLPRIGLGSTQAERIKAVIPDPRNDENLAVAQTHLAFIRFHNRVVDKLAALGMTGPTLFANARDLVVKHYQWMLRTDYLPRIVEPRIVEDVFARGRKVFEVRPRSGSMPTMPLEFSVAAFRLGHSMIRESYEWNRVFRTGGAVPGTLELLFQFSGTSGAMLPGFDRLPTNWVADFRRLFDFAPLGDPALVPPAGQFNVAKQIDTLLVDPLRALPLGSIGGRADADIERNLAFRNLTRADMVRLASGQQMATEMRAADPSIEVLTREQVLVGAGRGADMSTVPGPKRDLIANATPLWFYVLREAELNNGRLNGVGGRIVAEVFHRAMEGSASSIVRSPAWRPTLGPAAGRFTMPDLLFFAFEESPALLALLG